MADCPHCPGKPAHHVGRCRGGMGRGICYYCHSPMRWHLRQQKAKKFCDRVCYAADLRANPPPSLQLATAVSAMRRRKVPSPER